MWFQGRNKNTPLPYPNMSVCLAFVYSRGDSLVVARAAHNRLPVLLQNRVASVSFDLALFSSGPRGIHHDSMNDGQRNSRLCLHRVHRRHRSRRVHRHRQPDARVLGSR